MESVVPDTERWLNREAQEGAGVSGEDVADVSPLVRVQQVNVRGVLDPLPQVHQAAHQNLNVCEGRGTESYFTPQIKGSG